MTRRSTAGLPRRNPPNSPSTSPRKVLGAAPEYFYVYGGGGSARRSPLCLAHALDVWDAAIPFVGDDLTAGQLIS
jgi:hypothetical protein